ncbi:hypothetical protein DER29_0512 [Micromonospora sp. M71_S20]|uniref:hypothetical protein n=1 Tax=Micromonospora sp. M71_S20 TaxID=592872 RepID=UPI000EAD4765|nr:hypothetical protein [Micromonospora sp. M71_S20]RLK22673.1 hypothetical protein DER29_0512 [Micromonospora sp. M71_S20]
MSPEREYARAELAEILPKSAHRHIGRILDTLGLPEVVRAVDVVGARVPVETVEVYGLSIGLDANGNAATVGFPHGAEVSG